MREMSEAKRKELETRAMLGPKPKAARFDRSGPTAPPSTGGPRRRGRVGPGHPTRDSGVT